MGRGLRFRSRPAKTRALRAAFRRFHGSSDKSETHFPSSKSELRISEFQFRNAGIQFPHGASEFRSRAREKYGVAAGDFGFAMEYRGCRTEFCGGRAEYHNRGTEYHNRRAEFRNCGTEARRCGNQTRTCGIRARSWGKHSCQRQNGRERWHFPSRPCQTAPWRRGGPTGLRIFMRGDGELLTGEIRHPRWTRVFQSRRDIRQ